MIIEGACIFRKGCHVSEPEFHNFYFWMLCQGIDFMINAVDGEGKYWDIQIIFSDKFSLHVKYEDASIQIELWYFGVVYFSGI